MANEVDPKAAQQFAEGMKAAGAAAEEALGAFEKQARVVGQMRDAMEEVAKVMYALCQQDCKALNPDVWKNVTKEVLKNQEALKKQADAGKKVNKTFKEVSTTSAKLAKGLIFTGSVLTGLAQGMRNLVAIGRTAFNIITSIADGFYEVGKSIISIPFKMLSGLYSMASKGGDNSVRTELENIRENYGDLAGVSSRTVVGMAKSLDKFSYSGATAVRVFGNFAERLKASREFADSLGTSFDHFQQELTDPAASEALMRYQRALSFTAEQQGILANLAIKDNTSLDKGYNDLGKQVLGMSKTFNITSKILSKELGKAVQDLAHFGHLTKTELAASVAYTTKLGLSVEKLQGLMDQTKSYESTVENFSVINETFSTTIDYMKLMNLKSQGEKLDYLRKKFSETGKDMTNLSRAETDLLKSHLSLDDATLNTIFSAKNQGVTMEKVKTQAEKNAEAIVSQTDAMKALAVEIRQLTPAGNALAGGVFDHLLEGFLRGVQGSKEFIGMMMNIRTVLREATQYGVRLGRKFVEMFPGVSQVFEGIKDLFNPARFRRMFDGILRAFDAFTKTGSSNVEGFMENIQKTFLDFFNEGKEPGKRVISGFKKFGTALFFIVSKLASMAFNKIKSLFSSVLGELEDPSPTTLAIRKHLSSAVQDLSRFITKTFVPFARDAIVHLTSWLTDGKSIRDAAPVSKVTSAMGQIFGPLGDALMDAAEKLYPVLKKLTVTLVAKIKDFFVDSFSEMNWKQKLGFLLTTFGPQVSGLLFASLKTALFEKAAQKQITEGIEKVTQAGVKAAFMSNKIKEEAAAGAKVTQEAMAKGSEAAGAGASPGLISRLGSFIATPIGAGIAAALVLIGGSFALASSYFQSEVEKLEQETRRNDFIKSLNAPGKTTAERLYEARQQKRRYLAEAKDEEGTGFLNWLRGTKSEKEFALRAYADESDRFIKKLEEQEEKEARALVKGTPEFIQRVKEEQAKRADQYVKDRTEMLGPVTLENAADRFKKVEELAKKVMGKDFKIADKLEEIRNKLAGIDWMILKPEDEEKINQAFSSMQKVQGIMVSITDITGLLKVAFDRLLKVNRNDVFEQLDKLRGLLKDTIEMMVLEGENDKLGHQLSLSEVWTPKIVRLFGGLKDSSESVKLFLDTMRPITEKSVKDNMGIMNSAISSAIMTVWGHDPEKLAKDDELIPKISSMFSGLRNSSESLAAFLVSMKPITEESVRSNLSIMQRAVWMAMTALSQTPSAQPLDADKLKTLPEIIQDVDRMFSRLKSASGTIADFNTEANKKGIANIKDAVVSNIKAIGEIVAATQVLENSLNSIPTIDIGGKLSSLASGLGMGGNFSYEVKKKDVIVSIDLHVLVDSTELEKSVLSGKKSIIRDRVNLALSGEKTEMKQKGILTGSPEGWQQVATNLSTP